MLSLVMRYASLALQSRSSHCIFSFALKKISASPGSDSSFFVTLVLANILEW